MVFVALAAAALIAVVALVTLLAGQRPMFGKTVAIVDVRGVIQDASDTIDTLERLREADNTVAIVLRIDSPGGSVAPSQEIYDEVWRVREQKPVIASLGSVAASGGYYVASAANRILADPGTITGSIGAIMTVPYYAPLADKIGFSEENVKSGRFKDTGHPLRRLNPDERALLQNVVDDVLGQFVDAVARGRHQPAARIRALADGRIYSGAQALAAGLVDQLGGLHEATQVAWKDAGQSGEPRVQRLHARRLPWFLQLLGDALTDVAPASRGGLFFLYQGSHPE
jgi:protease-4